MHYDLNCFYCVFVKKESFFDYRIISFCIVSMIIWFRLDILFVLFQLQKHILSLIFHIFSTLLNSKHDEKIFWCEIYCFWRNRKIDKFPFQSHICNNAEKMMWKIFTSTQASVYMYMCMCVFWILNCETIVNLLNILLTRRGTHKVYILHMSDILSFAPTYVY